MRLPQDNNRQTFWKWLLFLCQAVFWVMTAGMAPMVSLRRPSFQLINWSWLCRDCNYGGAFKFSFTTSSSWFGNPVVGQSHHFRSFLFMEVTVSPLTMVQFSPCTSTFIQHQHHHPSQKIFNDVQQAASHTVHDCSNPQWDRTVKSY